MASRPHIKLSVADMNELVSGAEPPLALLHSLAAELKHRESPAAVRLRERIVNDIGRREQGANWRPNSESGKANRQTGGKDKTKDSGTQNEGSENSKYTGLLARYEAVVADLKIARERETQLQAEVVKLRARQTGDDPLFSRVYLASNAPRWLILDVQRAFRVRYQPDRHEGPDKRSKAERVFQDAEQVFSKILNMTA